PHGVLGARAARCIGAACRARAQSEAPSCRQEDRRSATPPRRNRRRCHRRRRRKPRCQRAVRPWRYSILIVRAVSYRLLYKSKWPGGAFLGLAILPRARDDASNRRERLIEIGDEIIRVLEPDRQPHQAVIDAERGAFLRLEAMVGRGGGVSDQALAV